MMSLSSLGHYAPIWLLIALIIIIYAAAKATKLIESNWILWLFSVILAFAFFSSRHAVNYLLEGIPVITVVLTIGFFLVLMLVLIAKDIEVFKRPIAIISCILGLVILIALAFSHFHVLNHMLPGTSDYGLNSGLEEFKDFIYSKNFKDTFIFIIAVGLVSFFILKKK
jgi:hypothetical protein